MSTKQVDHYLSEHEDSFRDREAFESVFAGLKIAELSREELVEIATCFMAGQVSVETGGIETHLGPT